MKKFNVGQQVQSLYTYHYGVVTEIRNEQPLIKCWVHEEYHSPLFVIEWEKNLLLQSVI